MRGAITKRGSTWTVRCDEGDDEHGHPDQQHPDAAPVGGPPQGVQVRRHAVEPPSGRIEYSLVSDTVLYRSEPTRTREGGTHP